MVWAPVRVMVILVVVELKRLVLHLEEFGSGLLNGRLTAPTGRWWGVEGRKAKVKVFFLAGDFQDPLEIFHQLGKGGTMVWVEMPAVSHQKVKLHAALGRLLHPETSTLMLNRNLPQFLSVFF